MFGWFSPPKSNDVEQATRAEAIAKLVSRRDATLVELRGLVERDSLEEATAQCDELQRLLRTLDSEVMAMREELQGKAAKSQDEQIKRERDALRQEVAEELRKSDALGCQGAGLQRKVEELEKLVATQGEELQCQVEALEAEREEVHRLEAQRRGAEALRNASVTITASVDHLQTDILKDQVLALERERDSLLQEVESISELEAVRTNSQYSGSPRHTQLSQGRSPPLEQRHSVHSGVDSDTDVQEEVEKLQEYLQAMLKEREELRDEAAYRHRQLTQTQADLEAERQKGAQWEETRRQSEALHAELLVARQAAERAAVQEAAATKELAVSHRKQELLCRRLVELSTRIEVPAVEVLTWDDAASQSSKSDMNTPRHSVQRFVSGPEVLLSARSAKTELEATRGKVSALKAKWEIMRKEAHKGSSYESRYKETAQQLSTVQEEKETLAKELSQLKSNERKRRTSHANVSKNLTEIATKLNNAETSWNPWQEINDCKTLAATVQDVVEDGGTNALQVA